MDLPLVSICMPAYHADAYLSDALESVGEQTFRDWELIVTEDGSKDRTEELVRDFSETVSQRVVYNRHASNLGLPHARNTGVAAAWGRWIALLDADDYWDPSHLARLVSQAAHSAEDLVFTGFRRLRQKDGVLEAPSTPSKFQLERLGHSVFCGSVSILPSCVLLDRMVFSKYGPWSTAYRHANDTEYWLRLLTRGGKIGYATGATCVYRDHQASLSKRLGELMEESAQVCATYARYRAVALHARRSRPAALYRGAARFAETSDIGKAADLLAKAWLLDPLNPKTLLRLMQVGAKTALRARRQRQPRLSPVSSEASGGLV